MAGSSARDASPDGVRDPPGGGSTPLLRVVGVTKRFGSVVANRDVSLTVRRGEIHGLLGENGAGKTTLMNVVCGLVAPDEGRVEIDGATVDLSSSRHALELGVGMVHQHFSLVSNMTVTENVAVGVSAGRLRRTRLSRVGAQVRELSERYGLDVTPGDVIEDLSVGARQRVEILKLLYRGAELLILDEPTATLTPPEWHRLAAVLGSLVALGKAAILITHKLAELFGVADTCTVLRGGRVVGEAQMSETGKSELAEMMLGRVHRPELEKAPQTPGASVLAAARLASSGPGVKLCEIDLTVREREILGIAGVDGNGQRELVELLTGMRKPVAGRIRIGNAVFTELTPRQFKAASGGVIPEDHRHTGLALGCSVAENLVLKDFEAAPYSRRGMLNRAVIRAHARRLVEAYDIRCASIDTVVRALSGGSRQKIVVARELEREPKLLIAAQPTRGLDIAATEAVHRRLLEYRDGGGAVLLISVEIEELLALTDRIAVMVKGRLVQTIETANASATTLGLLMAGENSGPPRHDSVL